MTESVKPKASALTPGTKIGGYRIVRQISSGGFGLVYLVHDDAGKPFAIKEYLPSALVERAPGDSVASILPGRLTLYQLGLKSFFEEARALTQISNSSVVSVSDFFRQNETVYLVMEYLQGASLQDFIVAARARKKEKVFRESTIMSLLDEILRGLRVVHRHNLLHLDLKPANIFITDDDRAVMMDFGAAREALNQDKNFSRPMYTPGFAASELYHRNEKIGPWTDLYAIGACLFSCMQGYPPDDAQRRNKKDRLDLKLSRFRGIYSDNLIDLVRWCMNLKAEDRPQSVFMLQKKISQQTQRHHSKMSARERIRLGLNNVLGDTQKNIRRLSAAGAFADSDAQEAAKNSGKPG